VRLLRVLENGEFIKVGSSQVQKTNVRIVAATNVNMFDAIEKGKFREDLYYRLSTVEIALPPLRERKDDIHLLFRKFAADFAHKYKMPAIRLEDNAVDLLLKYRWSGNIRQLRNIAEQISILETQRSINKETLENYLPFEGNHLPTVVDKKGMESDLGSERELLYKIIFDMKNEINELKKITFEVLQQENISIPKSSEKDYSSLFPSKSEHSFNRVETPEIIIEKPNKNEVLNEEEEDYWLAETVEEEETLRLDQKEIELIKKALDRNKGKRKAAADELGISERTLYRKIKQFDL
jgi:transcriptional regulator with PAS, ATPase and Fis domain